MLREVLNERLDNAIKRVPYNNLCELRLRANNSAIVNIMGENYYLKDYELSKKEENAI